MVWSDKGRGNGAQDHDDNNRRAGGAKRPTAGKPDTATQPAE
jgi:hypothetical protein